MRGEEDFIDQPRSELILTNMSNTIVADMPTEFLRKLMKLYKSVIDKGVIDATGKQRKFERELACDLY